MRGRKDDRRGGAVRQQRLDEQLRADPRALRIGEALLGRKGVRLEPVEQLFAVARDHVELRHVDVGVDEAGQDQPAGVVVALVARVGRIGLRADDPAGVDQQPVVGAEAHGGRLDLAPRRLGGEVEQVATQCEFRGGGDRCGHAGQRAALGEGGKQRRSSTPVRILQ